MSRNQKQERFGPQAPKAPPKMRPKKSSSTKEDIDRPKQEADTYLNTLPLSSRNRYIANYFIKDNLALAWKLSDYPYEIISGENIDFVLKDTIRTALTHPGNFIYGITHPKLSKEGTTRTEVDFTNDDSHIEEVRSWAESVSEGKMFAVYPQDNRVVVLLSMSEIPNNIKETKLLSTYTNHNVFFWKPTYEPKIQDDGYYAVYYYNASHNVDSSTPGYIVDVINVQEISWVAANIWYSSTREDNVQMESAAKKVGYYYHEYGLTSDTETIYPTSIEHLKKVINMTS